MPFPWISEKGERMKNKAAVELGRRGGRARKKGLTPQERSAIARRAVLARWEKRKAEKKDRRPRIEH